MRVLVIGASGFAGAALIDHLAGIRGISITAIVHRTQPRNQPADIRFVSSSQQKLPALLPQLGEFDYIFHLARIPGRKWGNAGRVLAGMQGYFANKRLLRTLNSFGDNARLVYLSGSLMYGHNPGKTVLETNRVSPAGFGKYYHLAELPLLQAIKRGCNNIIMLRAPWILGNGSWFKQLYTRHIQQHASVPAYGSPGRRMSVITVEDCAGMLWHYATNTNAAGVYNIYTFHNILYSSFIQSVSNAFGLTAITQYDEQKMRQTMDNTTVDSVCCEVVLGTNHEELLNGYVPLYPDLDDYLTQLAKKV